jgi:hypothetical protein
MPTDAPKLDYAPHQAAWRRRSTVRWVLIAIVLAVLLPPAVKFAARGVHTMRINRLFADCAAKVSPTVALSDNAVDRRTLKSGRGYATVNTNGENFVYHVPPEWAEVLAGASVNLNSIGTAYLGERRAQPVGARLVGVDLLSVQRGGPLGVQVATRTLARGASLSPPRLDTTTIRWLTICDVAGELRVLSGEADPNDASHFTIAYTVNGVPGVIDGWLNFDGTTLLEVRTMPTSIPATPPPTSAPASTSAPTSTPASGAAK